jgi:hypothetical protein
LIITTSCGHQLDSENVPEAGTWAVRLADLAAAAPGTPGPLFDCSACGTRQILVTATDERVISAQDAEAFCRAVFGPDWSRYLAQAPDSLGLLPAN